ncbi:ArsR family transcriptional regulator [Candidatus Woesearchaeota archaeon]|nr:ArsR family transcriptional regulator [Candidatus Woesearchaeota archaeon]
MADERKTYLIIRLFILQSLLQKEKSVNNIAHDTGINWRTVDKHLDYLLEQGLVSKFYFAEQLKIYSITELGRHAISRQTLQEVLA